MQCMPCLINRKRMWTSRLMLEQRMHDYSAFITLTYDDLHLPSDGSVHPEHLQLFLKRLRHYVAERIRFYGVGEYGDRSNRPHYHLAVFGGVHPLHIHPAEAAFRRVVCDCVVCTAWGQGGVDVADLTAESAAYIVSYTTKRLTRKGDPRLEGRHPEFARMSLRPGIGALAMPVLGEALTHGPGGAASIVSEGDVPMVVRHSKKLWPLGRYLRGKLREEVGMDSAMPAAKLTALQVEMQQGLSQPMARQRREDKREQSNRIAEARNKISNSRKGIGL